MLNKTVNKIVALSLVVLFSGVELMAQKRITFKRGTSSATVRARIAGKGYEEYMVNGRAGQVMSIEITSGNGAVVVNAGTATGKSFSLDMTGGDHMLSIVNQGGKATNYTLTVSIR